MMKTEQQKEGEAYEYHLADSWCTWHKLLYYSHRTENAVVIDPGANAKEIAEVLKKEDLNPVWTLLTHGHHDHTGGVRALKSIFPEMKTAIGEFDAEMLNDVKKALPFTNLPDEEMFREMLIYQQYIYSGLFEYFAGEDCEAIDSSDEAVKEFMKDYNCAVHILLTQSNYSTKEN